MLHARKLFPLVILLLAGSILEKKSIAAELRIPRTISCSKGSVIIKQVAPAETYEQTKTAAFTLTVNGKSENATGIENGNFTKVTSKSWYVFGGTGGLTFAKNTSSADRVICTNSKYGITTPGFEVRF